MNLNINKEKWLSRFTNAGLLTAFLAFHMVVLTQDIHAATNTVNKTLASLLQDVEQLSQKDQALNQERESRFLASLAEQKSLLAKSVERLAAADAEQERLKQVFDSNEEQLAELEALLSQRSGQLGEVFGVAKENASELIPVLQDSMITAEHPSRLAALQFADRKAIPTLNELQQLWYQMQLEMTASGEIKVSPQEVVTGDGDVVKEPVLRIGVFTAATTDGRYIDWNVAQQQWQILPTQPSVSAQQALASYSQGGTDDVLLDPSRGQLLQLLDRIPSVVERLHQGGEVGYLIIALGCLGLVIAVWRVLYLFMLELKINAQLRNETPKNNNPLGRVLLAAKASGLTLERLEMKVEEAILRELPILERGQSIIKLLAAVAPLLGLLGTVVGMIATFQSITLFGTGDPKLMAGGISQALMTTVLGLVVSVPLLFSHSLLASRGRRLQQILQEKSLAVLVTKTPDPADAAITTEGESRAA